MPGEHLALLPSSRPSTVEDEALLSKKKGKLNKILVMLVVMFLYSALEVGVSLYYGSLVMFSDGLHNLSDGIALVVAYWAENMKLKAGGSSLTYGWRRTELLGGLFNGLFLVSMSIFILLQAVPEFIKPEMASDNGALLFMITAGVGIFLNVVGVLVFMSDGHGHSHGGHSHGSKKKPKTEGNHGHSHGHGHGGSDHGSVNAPSPSGVVSSAHGHSHDHSNHSNHAEEARDHNMWGLFIHFLGDVFTSILVCGVGLAYYFHAPPDPLPFGKNSRDYWVNYADPVSSIISVAIILISAWPLVKSCAWILLQSTPGDLDSETLKRKLRNLPDVHSTHELHVWQLVDSLTIASVHVVVSSSVHWPQVAKSIQNVFHEHGIHSSTIQPEFKSLESGLLSHTAADCAGGGCVDDCIEEQCCTTEKKMWQATSGTP